MRRVPIESAGPIVVFAIAHGTHLSRIDFAPALPVW